MNKKASTVAKISAFAVIGSLFLFAAGCNKSETQPAGGRQQESAVQQESPAPNLPEDIRLDYANWSPLSLVLRNQRFLEDEFKKDNVTITWAFSQGSNKSMEFLLSGSVDFASSAGMAAMVSFINGNPIKSIYMTNTSEISLMVPPNSEIKKIEDLKGKTISATAGTDPYLFLMRTLDLANLTLDDINIVNLQHPDGKNEMLRGRVDAWASLDPLQSQAELEGATYLYRNIDFSTHVVLSVRDEFAEKYPEAVKRVLLAYEKARQWAKENPEEYLALVVKEAKITPEVGKLMLDRIDLDVAPITDKFITILIETGNELKKSRIISQNVNLEETLDKLIDRSYFEELEK